MAVYLGTIPVGVVLGGACVEKEGLLLCDVEQIIDGDFCELIINPGNSDSNYVLGYVVDGDSLALYLSNR